VTLQELLNSDMDLATLAAVARQGFAWWIEELASMLPAGLRARLSSQPRVLAEPLDTGGWRVWRDGNLVEMGPTPTVKETVGILLPTSQVLVREVPAPRMPSADVRRMLSLDIDRLSPLAPELIHFDMEVIDRDSGEGKQTVSVGIVPRTTALALVERARAQGLKPATLGVKTGGEPIAQRFDFLPAVLEAAGEKQKTGLGVYLWGAVAALFVINLAVLVGRDMADVASLRHLAEAQRPAVSAALRLRGRVEAEEARRGDLVNRGQKNEPLRMLSILTQAIPSGAWVQHLEWNGQALHIVGFAAADVDMAAAIRGTGAFANPRSLTVEQTTGAASVRPFDITADARPAVRR